MARTAIGRGDVLMEVVRWVVVYRAATIPVSTCIQVP